jgi:hypothetical protein
MAGRPPKIKPEHKRRSTVVPIPGWTPKPNRGQQMAHHPTEDSRLLVETLTGFGVIQNEIADILDIHPSTLVDHYREQLTLGAHKANAAVVANLFKIATDPDGGTAAVNAGMWWTKARMNWSETRKEAITADVRSVNANVRDLTDEQLLEIIHRGRGRSDGAVQEKVEPGKLQ